MELYVGNLPENFSENELKSLFKPYRFKKLRIEKESGKSGLSGFVEIPDIAAAIKARWECNGMTVKGRKIQVCNAEEREQIGKTTVQKKKAASAPKEKHFSVQKRKPSFDSKGKFSSGQKGNFSSAPKGKSQDAQRTGQGGKNGEFPYRFCKRKTVKIKPSAWHDKLNEGNYDIAFEIAWTSLTPAALNPCTDIAEKATMPENSDSEFAAYNKRWLMPDDHLLISPFTVKSAIANGFANVMGGCYRVIAKEEGHPSKEKEGQYSSEVKDGQYYYKGGYKRYRVSMDNSKPGIIKEITVKNNGDRVVKIQPVTEYYYDYENPQPGLILEPDSPYLASTFVDEKNKHKHFIKEGSLRPAPKNAKKAFIYYGEYCFGMDLKLIAPNMEKRHYHRFYEENCHPLSTTIPAVNFKKADDLKGLVYMGSFKRLPPNEIDTDTMDKLDKKDQKAIKEFYFLYFDRKKAKNVYKLKKEKRAEKGHEEQIFNLFEKAGYNYDPRKIDGEIWYEDLRNLKPGDWVYYHMLNGKITNIGKNFQFKAMFFHEDAVPEDGKLCSSKNCLCPRCRMFGMTEEKQNDKKREAAAFKGRFKASALRNDSKLKPGNPVSFPIPGLNQRVSLKKWEDESGKPLAYQALMPIAGPPKPNKRDINGYFEKSTGQIKGAKVYKHGKLDSAKDIGGVDTNPPAEYTHRLRNYAMVCEPGLVFTGTVGAENASPEEIAALILLLDSGVKNHGFKLGLGKAFGMGSFSSAITKVWIRRKQDYEWKTAENWKSLEQCFPDIQNEIKLLEKIEDFQKKVKDFQINATTGWEKRNLDYPNPVAKDNPDEKKYWEFLQNSK